MVSRLIIGLVFSLLPAWADAALVHDQDSAGKCNSSTCSITHTVSGVDRVLYITVQWLAGVPPDQATTAVTFHGDAATLLGGTSTVCVSGITCRVELWRLLAPDAGTHTIEATFAGSGFVYLGGVSFTGADQTTPEGTLQTGTGTGTSLTLSVPSASTEIVLGLATVPNLGGSFTPVSATSTFIDFDQGGFTRVGASFMAGQASTNYAWTHSVSAPFAIIAVPIKPAGGSAPPTFDTPTYDTHTTATTITSGTALSWNITPGATCKIIVIGAIARHSTTAPTLNTVTVGGSPATFVRRQANAANVSAVELWYFVSPATGSPLTVVGTYAAAINDWATGTAICFAGVNTSSPINGHTVTNGTGHPSLSLETTVDNVMVVDVFFSAEDTGATVGAGQTARGNAIVTGATNIDVAGMSHEGPKTPPGSVSMDWTANPSASFAHAVLGLVPATLTGPVVGTTELLRWDDHALTEMLFRLQWKHAAQPAYSDLAVLGIDIESFLVNFTTETSRCYRVRAENTGGPSPFSNELCSAINATGPILPPLAAPTKGGGLSDE